MDIIDSFPSTEVQKNVEPVIDVGNLLLIDREPGDMDDTSLKERARDNAQLLFNAIWQLERQQIEDAVVAVLPPPTFRLPREKAIPQPRQPTKWEEYAKAKGIKKRKKDKKQYDETSGEWKPTYGYRRGNDDTKDWVIEIPRNADPNKDYFAERIEAKKERVAKNEMQRLKNIARQLNTTIKKGDSTDKLIGVGVNPMQKSKQQVRYAADRAKTATASAGKFQETIKGEKPNIKTGRKRKFEPNEGKVAEENKRALQILDKIKTKKAKIIEAKAAEIAGPVDGEEREKKERGKKSKKPARMHSQIHRQQWFKAKVKGKKANRGNAKKNKK